jgi:hypothetical protein
VAYILKKYSLDHYLPIPRSKRYINDEIVAVIPTKASTDFMDVMVKEEECKVTLMKVEDYTQDFENTYIYEVNEKIGGVNTVNLSIFKRV